MNVLHGTINPAAEPPDAIGETGEGLSGPCPARPQPDAKRVTASTTLRERFMRCSSSRVLLDIQSKQHNTLERTSYLNQGTGGLGDWGTRSLTEDSILQSPSPHYWRQRSRESAFTMSGCV